VDDLGGHAGAGLIDRLGGQLQPVNPTPRPSATISIPVKELS
jgi:hypothetical protein